MDSIKKMPVILDGDPGHDDAIAWVLAKAMPELDIKAITTVAGNQTLDKTTYNALRIATLVGIDAPIAKGNDKPLMTDLFTAGNYHGETGLDGPKLPKPNRELSKYSAVELMAKVLRESEKPITIIPTGPLTNVASLLLAHPELKPKIKQFSIMGGGIYTGNWTAAAEFNIIEDPKAAQVVFTSGIPLQMSGLDVTLKAMVMPEEFHRFRALNNQVATIVADWLDFFMIHHADMGYIGAPLHDPCAIVSLVHPELFEIKDMHVDIEVEGEYTTGQTVAHIPTTTPNEIKENNCKVVLNVKREKFVDFLVETCKAYQGWEVQIDD